MQFVEPHPEFPERKQYGSPAGAFFALIKHYGNMELKDSWQSENKTKRAWLVHCRDESSTPPVTYKFRIWQEGNLNIAIATVDAGEIVDNNQT